MEEEPAGGRIPVAAGDDTMPLSPTRHDNASHMSCSVEGTGDMFDAVDAKRNGGHQNMRTQRRRALRRAAWSRLNTWWRQIALRAPPGLEQQATETLQTEELRFADKCNETMQTMTAQLDSLREGCKMEQEDLLEAMRTLHSKVTEVTEAATQTVGPCYYRALKHRIPVTVATDTSDLVCCNTIDVAVDTSDHAVPELINPMDFMYDVAMEVVGDDIIGAEELIEECQLRIDDAYHGWLEAYRITGTAVAVKKQDDRIVFLDLSNSESRRVQALPAELLSEATGRKLS